MSARLGVVVGVPAPALFATCRGDQSTLDPRRGRPATSPIPENMIRWLIDPQAVEPGTAMPNLGMSEADARHIAAYLYTLR